MPQIAQLAETWSSQVFWLLVFFGITFFVIGRGMVPRVMETVAQRDGQIAADLAAAKAARDAADAEEEAWRVRENKKLAEAEDRIAEARTAALTEVEAVAAEAAQDIVSRLAGFSVTKPVATKAVKEALSHG